MKLKELFQKHYNLLKEEYQTMCDRLPIVREEESKEEKRLREEGFDYDDIYFNKNYCALTLNDLRSEINKIKKEQPIYINKLNKINEILNNDVEYLKKLVDEKIEKIRSLNNDLDKEREKSIKFDNELIEYKNACTNQGRKLQEKSEELATLYKCQEQHNEEIERLQKEIKEKDIEIEAYKNAVQNISVNFNGTIKNTTKKVNKSKGE